MCALRDELQGAHPASHMDLARRWREKLELVLLGGVSVRKP